VKRAALVALVLAGCDPVWQVHTKVKDPSGAVITGASLALTCPDARGYAALTDDHGDAYVGGIGAELPGKCTIVVSDPGRRSYRITLEEQCAPHKVENCWRVRNIEVVLAPE
jgi:hypothetical protein